MALFREEVDNPAQRQVGVVIVNQREVGTDTHSFHDALANTLRQAPDVILIGEIRHMETMEHALAFAETGHLCLSTLCLPMHSCRRSSRTSSTKAKR